MNETNDDTEIVLLVQKQEICKKVLEFKKNSKLPDEDLARALRLSQTQLALILNGDTQKISLSTLYEIKNIIAA